ncbi:MAG: F0F1 ATP synthase subunit A [Flavobacteriales bacterium]|nr:F0F1 ATP synthase subunit A [Flavobacteriales bacterium]
MCREVSPFGTDGYLCARISGAVPPASHVKPLLRAAFLLILGVLSSVFTVQASGSEEGHHGKEPFDPGHMIMGHVGDEHGWHLFGHTTLPLPIIAYNTERGLSVFSSGRFDHGHKTYGGYMLLEGKLVATTAPDGTPVEEATRDEALTKATWDISITKNVAGMLTSVVLMLLIFLSVAKGYRTRGTGAPKGLQSFIEPIILFVRDDVAKPNIGPKYGKFMPFLLTVFFFILINNLMGLIPIAPFGANVTGSISVTFALAVFTFLITLYYGNRHYWGHILAMPGVPKPVLLILTPVEILGVFLRPAILMIRLFANITAGHIIVLSFFALIFIFGEINAGLGWGVSVFTLVFTVFMSMLELLVAFIQAFVFTFLSAMYFGAAVEEHHEHKESLV